MQKFHILSMSLHGDSGLYPRSNMFQLPSKCINSIPSCRANTSRSSSPDVQKPLIMKSMFGASVCVLSVSHSKNAFMLTAR